MSKLVNEVTAVQTALWLFRYVCLPITIPLVIYKLVRNMRERKRATLQLQRKVVVITGASSGLGEALAHVFYEQGCKVVLAARREKELQRVKNDLLSKNFNITTYPPVILLLDLAEINSLQSKVEEIYAEYGNIDILVNNGGISNRGNILTTNIDVDMKVMAVNYFGPVALTKAVLPKMVENRSGHILFVSSIQGRVAIPDRSSYAASKHALQAFADSLRAEIDQCNVKVSVISPGYINTAISVNALTASGEKYGAMDEATAAGYSAEYVANKVLDMILRETKELTLSTFQPKFAISIRYLIPSLYFWIMTKRASRL